jgi:hypothetical protein
MPLRHPNNGWLARRDCLLWDGRHCPSFVQLHGGGGLGPRHPALLLSLAEPSQAITPTPTCTPCNISWIRTFLLSSSTTRCSLRALLNFCRLLALAFGQMQQFYVSQVQLGSSQVSCSSLNMESAF